jgi:hypothetical protein
MGNPSIKGRNGDSEVSMSKCSGRARERSRHFNKFAANHAGRRF